MTGVQTCALPISFDFAGPVLDLTVSGFHHDLAGETSPMIQGTAARRFGDQQQFGVLVSAAWSKRKTQGFVFYNDEDYLAFAEDDPSARSEEHTSEL